MSEEQFPPLQVSFFIEDDQHVVRAGSAEELKARLVGLASNADEIGDALKKAKQILTLKHMLTKWKKEEKAAGSTGTAAPRAQAAPAAQSAPAKGCSHGEMIFRTSKPGAPKAWKAYFCPAPKGEQQCDPEWVK